MPKLHMFYLGGNAGRSNIEVHDIQFAVCDDYREAVPALKAAWFGDADKIHIDGWQVVEWADGYDIAVSETPKTKMPSEHTPHLYFANVGGYRAGQLAEAHAFGLFAAATPAEAKQKALQTLLTDSYVQQHKDNLKDVDNLLALDRIGNFHIRLTPNPHGKPAEIGFQGYLPI
ncbi:TPA: DUF1543 domain-containing protein [Neisseria meningitidis]|uniref:DUF1543 domain-containing protein n=1 Tax=Neisseria meningitidis TaxID=487 RepID=UPI0002687683|nr:DUF1543 domain-containing protein [Neisseria meningitidis]AJC62925.1 hypothetical protein N875_04455 [Neisseria meningitidis LNP21362]CCI72159.1 hypothetical protein BN21_0124 [Neisseria meningitidis alpha704]ANX21590.1 hypothetical protein A6L49_05365 [Neisseria meningitidis]ANX22804.1 hypothetical protein A6L47_00080 [Neisseria meningitidis]ANX37899.1 hypothetical protein A6L48_03290 [Neisseria meningitidis]